ncbi:MAG TPA: glycosyltransferase family A protein [Acidimicrobiia bacterium]|nr:glycosyltransferase family A protein [Acidimicrobiia bacterium]
MEHSPVVSVIVPVYDNARFLHAALESVAAQDYEPLDIIIVDDGSRDSSRAIAEAFSIRTRNARVLHQQNRGPAAARNRGLEHARGELVTFLDADDEMTQGRLTFQVRYLVDRPEVDAVVGREEITIEPGVEPPLWVRQLPPDRPTYQPVSLMVWRRWFDDVGKFEETYQIGEDTEWLSRFVSRGGRLDRVDRVVLHRRIHGGNLTYRGVGSNLMMTLHARIRERKGRA